LFFIFAGTGISSSCKLIKPIQYFSMQFDKLNPFFIPPAAPLSPGPGGIDIRVLVRSVDTNKQFSCAEFALAAKKMGPAPHYHKELDELMYVLEGTVSVIVDDKLYEVPAGGWHMRPRGLVHTFFNNTDKPFRAVDMYFNQNFEDYLEEMFHRIIPDMQQQKLTPQHPSIAKRMHDLHEKFGMVGFPEKRQEIVERYGLIG
jgi:quercetin dioxygenase-like cupin family protein